jgi:hypothetical protein
VSDDTIRVEILSDEPARVSVEEPRSEVIIIETAPNEVLVNLVGLQGPVGPGLLTGAGAPTSTTGGDGDSYLDTQTGNVYGPKQDGEWPDTPSGSISTLTRRYVFSQPAAIAQWDVTHTLGGRPSVMVVDTSGAVVVGDVTYLSDSQLVVTFSAPFAGYAYLT